MSNFINNFKKEFELINLKIFKKNLINYKINIEKISFDINDNESRGHVSTNAAFIYNKHSKSKLNELIDFINKELKKLHIIDKIEVAGPGFINIFFKKDYLLKELFYLNKAKDKFGSSKLGKNKKINVEFISANPTGPLHIAHSRGAVFGDVLSNIFEKVGYKVTREYYVNDAGKQIEILGDSLFIRYKQSLNYNESINKEFYPGKYLVNIAKEIISKDGKKWINYNEKKRKIFFQNYAIRKILQLIKNDCKNINIKFDNFVSEKKIINSKIIDEVFKVLKRKNLLYEGVLDKPKGLEDSDWEPRKQLLFRSSNFGDDNDRPFLKSDNNWTYFANDSAYHYNKIKRGYHKLINIWGSDHIGYIKRMQSIVKVLSNDKINLNIKICQIVNLRKNNKPIRMSKRSGNFISINDIISEIGSDTLRFFMLYRKNDAQIDFDLSKVVEKTKDNPIFYINYAYARSCSVIENADKILKKFDIDKEIKKINIKEYMSSYEWQIILQILSWPNIIEKSCLSQEPHRIVYYLENLSSLFHIFWNKGKENKSLRFIDEGDLGKTISKIYWIKSMQIVYKSAFDILGIKLIKKM